MDHLRRLQQILSPLHLAAWLAVAVLTLAGLSLSAQTDQGTITGTITDPQGAVIPHAHVTLTEPSTGFVQQSASNKDGIYVFSPVKIGTYSVLVNASGFESVTQ